MLHSAARAAKLNPSPPATDHVARGGVARPAWYPTSQPHAPSTTDCTHGVGPLAVGVRLWRVMRDAAVRGAWQSSRPAAAFKHNEEIRLTLIQRTSVTCQDSTKSLQSRQVYTCRRELLSTLLTKTSQK